MTLNEKIGEILKKHKEGKEFFDALDAMIRGDSQILKQFIEFVKSSCKVAHGIVLSGEFGRALINNCLKDLLELSPNIILVNGGIRSGASVELYKDKLNTVFEENSFFNTEYIFLDDSIYSGKTINAIEEEFNKINKNIKIKTVFVVYDGSKGDIKTSIKSLFKYYK